MSEWMMKVGHPKFNQRTVLLLFFFPMLKDRPELLNDILNSFCFDGNSGTMKEQSDSFFKHGGYSNKLSCEKVMKSGCCPYFNELKDIEDSKSACSGCDMDPKLLTPHSLFNHKKIGLKSRKK